MDKPNKNEKNIYLHKLKYSQKTPIFLINYERKNSDFLGKRLKAFIIF
jgi:hypothetical protein